MPYDPTIEKYANFFYQQVDGEPLPSVGDGVTYSRALGWQSPEGNFYGQERWVRDWPVGVVWDGEDYRAIEVDGEAETEEELPIPGEINPRTGLPYGPRTHFELWAVPRLNWPPANLEIYDGRDKEYYYWDSVSESWQLIEWYYDVEGEENLRRPGLKIGAAHVLYYYDIKVMWNGLAWVRLSHEMLDLGENDYLHLTDGFMDGYTNYQTNTNGALQFLQSQQAEARLEFISKTNLGLLSSISGKTGALWVGGELLLTEDISNVENTDSVLQYSNGTITNDTVAPNTEYYVYCGNSDFTACSSGLFLSLTPDVNGRLGNEDHGLNARIVGVVETDSAGYFIREIDQSYIGRKVEFSQTYWEYSDFFLRFNNEEHISFELTSGAAGMCYVAGQLIYLGSGKDLYADSYRVGWSEGILFIDTTDIKPLTRYYVYIVGDATEYNFNEENTETGFPKNEGDTGYIWQLDFRRRLFLSEKVEDNRVLDQQYPGYYARHLGSILTDSNGKFIYSPDISQIRSLQLNPTDFAGLAEISIKTVSTSQFKIVKKPGTSGTIYVGGQAVQTFTATSAPDGHNMYTNTVVYVYNEATPETPLTSSGHTVSYYANSPVYIYLANDLSNWGSLSSSLFACTRAPSDGSISEVDMYLSENFPGNSARWIATIKPSVAGTFVDNYVVSSVLGTAIGIDDYNSSVSTTYSSARLSPYLVPTGTVLDYAGTSPPSGWLLCNGQQLSTSTYSALFAVIGYIYGGSGGSFKVPNLNSRTTIGYDGRWAIGTVVGEETHTLNSNEIPSHDHTHTHSHNHGGSTGGEGPRYMFNGEKIIGFVNGGFPLIQSLSHSHSISTDATPNSSGSIGGSQAHNNIQPSMCIVKMIKY